ncbi:MAG: alpha-1,3/4-fucosidase [Flavobacteriaceae bacterium]|nr:MAG: alpha-1,3/4-fucosidase [Flavobacteriaceae bacterium]
MKITVQFILMAFLLFSCTDSKELKMDVNSTKVVLDSDSKEAIITKAAHTVPTANQYSALKNEFIAFIHFGPNTFTRMEWGNGMEDPKVFALENLDTDQWCKAMKSAGMKMVVFTAKHHDGFTLWQSRYTKQGLMSSPFRDGKGDIMKDLSESCQKYGLKLGVYLSPADLYHIENKDGLYGNLSEHTERTIPRAVAGRPFKNKTTFTFKLDDYNEYFLNQLFELLTEYGPIHEVWFDGAHPKRKGGQKYNYMAWKELISTLAPEAVIFGKQDIRWCGNESGKTRATEWNIIPYQEDPNQMNRFGDIMAESIGSREQLYGANFLHYQFAETNTSIREGWFYRDDTKQKVRSADDVFDIYERSVGGNSVFLLNIPPNREGKFSDEDVAVLAEVGKRIKETYETDLFEGAKGPKSVLDQDNLSFELLKEGAAEIIITTPTKITINRLAIQEAISTHSERIEAHIVEAWIDNAWKEIVRGTNVGYKEILRFPTVTSDKFRISVTKARLQPAIAKISAHYYNTRPPQLAITRDNGGMLAIQAKKHDFGWKPHGEDVLENLHTDFEIRYTLDGTNPTKNSTLFEGNVIVESKEIRAVAIENGLVGSVASTNFGLIKKGWKVLNTDSENSKHSDNFAIDEDPSTYWRSNPKRGPHFIAIDLGKTQTLKGFSYTPQTDNSEGMIEQGRIYTSTDGRVWKVAEDFEFGNLINDPVTRKHDFKSSVQTRYIKIESKTIAGGQKTAAIAELDFYER